MHHESHDRQKPYFSKTFAFNSRQQQRLRLTLIRAVLPHFLAKPDLQPRRQVIICDVTSTGDVPTFETMNVTESEYKMYPDSLQGPCSEWLGELCDDGQFCTVDYDDELHTCLPFPREVISTCVPPSEQ